MENKIDVAVLGIGNMGATHVKAAKASPFVNKIYGYEPDEERATLRGKELEIETTSNLEEILRNDAVKLIYIASPNGTHSELAIQAMRAGKAVLCEKPMGEDLESAQKMVEVQKESGVFLQIGFELHYSKSYMQAKEWIKSGVIGSVVNTHCRYYCSEFHLKNSWRSNSPGSLIGEKLSHYLDLQRWFVDSPVKSVYSMTAPNIVTYFNHPDNHQINIKFENGAISNLNFIMSIAESDSHDPLLDIIEKQADDGHALTFYIFGTKGAIEVDVFKRRIRRWAFTDSPEKLVSEIVETITYGKDEDNEWVHNVHGQNIRISELVAKGLPPENPVNDSLETMKLCFAAEQSEQEERVVKLSELA